MSAPMLIAPDRRFPRSGSRPMGFTPVADPSELRVEREQVRRRVRSSQQAS